MGRPSFKNLSSTFRRKSNVRATATVVAIGTLLLFFQNCGKAGLDDGDSVASLTADTAEVKKFKAAPFPYDVNINQVAFMSCPAKKVSQDMGEDVESPFFTLRVGAFDNRVLAARYPSFFPAMSDPEKTARLNAGVGLSNDFMTYMKSTFAARIAASTKSETTQRLFRDSIMNTLPDYKLKISSGLVLITRNSTGFAWKQDHAKGILDTLSNKNMANQISLLPDLGAPYGTDKLQMVSGVETTQRSFLSSISVPENATQLESFRTNISRYEFAVGFTKPELEGDVFNLASPTGDNNYTLYGKTYRFQMSKQWVGRIDRYTTAANGPVIETGYMSSINSDFIAGVEEFETLTQGNSVNLTTHIDGTKKQSWSCFSLMVVRDVDRRDPKTFKILDPGQYGGTKNCALWNSGCLTKLKYYDYQKDLLATSPLVPGVKTACPIQEVGSPTSYGTLNYTGDNGLGRLRLEVARRFLPAEYWDINTSPEYMCAVPRSAAGSFGDNCYESGDRDATKFILYTMTAKETLNGTTRDITCGKNGLTGELNKECPAFVSMCYRTR